MIAHLNGELANVEADYVVIDVGGVGYKVYAPLSVISMMPQVGSKVKLLTYTHVKEDSITLYGFVEAEERNMFELLLTVSGVGPKVALNILSVLPVESIVEAISRDDSVMLNRVPGVGNKMSQRIALELREKITNLAWVEKPRKPPRLENMRWSWMWSKDWLRLATTDKPRAKPPTRLSPPHPTRRIPPKC